MSHITNDILHNYGGVDHNSLSHILAGSDNPETNNSLIHDSLYIDTEALSAFLTPLKDSFSVISLNIQSLNAKFDSLVPFLSELHDENFNFSALCFQETWVKDGNGYSLLSIPDYTAIPYAASVSSHSGLVTYLHKSFTYKQRQFTFRSDIWEGQFIDVFHPKFKRKITICNVYRPPRVTSQHIQLFLNDISKIFDELTKEKSELIFMGDFNIDLLRVNEKAIIGEYLDTLVGYGFIPSITLPTRIHTSATLIDNIFYKFSRNAKSVKSGIILNNLSDHLPCFLCVDFQHNFTPPPKFITIQTLHESAINNFVTEISNLNLISQINTQHDSDPNLNYNMLETHIKNVKNKHLPIRTVKFRKRKHKLSPWVTHGIIHSINYRDKLYKQVKSTESTSTQHSILKQNLKVYNSILKRTIRQAKFSYYHSQFNKYKHDSRQTWKLIGNILNRKESAKEFPLSFKINNEHITDKQSIADSFNSFFASIGSDLASNIQNDSHISFDEYLTETQNSTFSFHAISPSDIEKLISKLPNKNSAGHDDINSKIIKRICTFIAEPLSVVINQSFFTGIFPVRLKMAKVIPIFKKDDDTVFTNYRPISLLPVISKLFEKIAYTQFYTYLTTNRLLNTSQHGFRTLHSTESAAYEFIDVVNSFLDSGLIPVSVHLDLSKAFDTLDHSILLKKLQFYGVAASSLQWFRTYLGQREQFILFDGLKSSVLNLTTGVPQGSVLGPLLFLVYINDISLSSHMSHTILYADDTTLVFPTSPSNIESCFQTINREISKVSDWLKANKLCINSKKSRYMVFHYNQRTFDYDNFPPLYIDNSAIERTSEFNFLGLIIHETLNWKAHIAYISTKISRATGCLKRLQNTVPSHVLKAIYNSLILPHLNYCILAWGSTISRVFKLQKKAIRIINNQKYNSHTDPLYKGNKMLKLSDIYTLKALKFHYQYTHNNVPFYFRNIFAPNTNPNPYDTRFRHREIPQIPHHSSSSNTLRYKIPKIVSSMHSSVTDKVGSHSYEGFSYYVKQYLISLYNENCTIHNCYICNPPLPVT